jgi:aryl-alcohol dehydrogenase-like predicted oxidoreductase
VRTKNNSIIDMGYRDIGNLKPSVLGVGGLHFGTLCDQATATSIIHRALDAGVNFIDTAPLYGDGYSEGFIGNAIKGRRHNVIIATKVGLVPSMAQDGTFGVSVIPLNKKSILSSVEGSLRALGTDYIDLFQVHAYDPNTPVEETMATLDRLVQEGKVRCIGCSNYLRGELKKATAAVRKGGVRFASFQAHYNLIERRAEQEVFPDCHKLGVGIICNRPLSRGILTGKYKPAQPLPQDSRAVSSYRIRRWLSESTLLLVSALEELALNDGRTVAELAIAWLLAQNGVSVVLAGVRDLQQLEVNIRATNWILSSKELARIDEIIDKMNLMVQVKAMPETLFET